MFSCMIIGRATPTVKGGELVVVRDLAVTEKGSLQSFVGNFFFSVLQFYISVVCFGMTRM